MRLAFADTASAPVARPRSKQTRDGGQERTLQGTRRSHDVNEIAAGRSDDQDNPHGPWHLRMRAFDRDLIRGGHYDQRSYGPHKQAEHVAAPTNLQSQDSPCQQSRPPMTHRRSSDARPRGPLIAAWPMRFAQVGFFALTA